MLLIGGMAWIVLGMLTVLMGVQSGSAVLIGFILVVVAGITAGTYISVRYITPSSVLHPVVAAAAIGLMPAGVVLEGETGFVRLAILVGVSAVATVAAFISCSVVAQLNKSLERTREG